MSKNDAGDRSHQNKMHSGVFSRNLCMAVAHHIIRNALHTHCCSLILKSIKRPCTQYGIMAQQEPSLC